MFWEIIVLLCCMAAISYYAAVTFPKQLVAEGRGALASRFVPAALFVFGNFVIFGLLIVAVFVGLNIAALAEALASGDIAKVLKVIVGAAAAENTQAEKLERIFDSETMVTAAAALFGLFAFQRWRRIEAGGLRQLHNISLVPDDEEAIRERLRACDFHPPESTNQAGANLQRLEEFIASGAAQVEPGDLAVKHLKLEALIRIWTEDPRWKAVLPLEAVPDLETANKLVERKVRLAKQVLAHVDEIERGERDPEALEKMVAQLSPEAAPEPELLEQLHTALSGNQDPALIRRSLGDLLQPLLNYFHEEYDERIEFLVSATARSVVMAGDEGGERLSELERAGFSGFGPYPVLSLHKALGITLMVMLTIFVIFSIAPMIARAMGLPEPPHMGPFAALMTINLTLATVIGVMVGGLRNLARRDEMPWGWWFLAAGIVGLAHMGGVILMTAAGWAPDVNPTGEEGGSISLGFAAVNALVPLILVLGICRLGSRPPTFPSLPERAGDALALGLVMLGAGVVMVLAATTFGVSPSNVEGEPLAKRLAFVGGICALIGVAVGRAVLIEVRKVARSDVVERAAARGTSTADDRPAQHGVAGTATT